MLAAYWRGEITLRKLRVLVQHLPPGGAAYRAIQGHGWVEEHFLLADLIDTSQHTTAAVYRVNAGRKRVRNPKRYPRPTDERPSAIGDRAGRSTAEVLAYLNSLKPPKEG